MKTIFSVLAILILTSNNFIADNQLTGAWTTSKEGSTICRIYSGGHFAVSIYKLEEKTYQGTYGGKYSTTNGELIEVIEFDTQKPERIGTEIKTKFTVSGKVLRLAEEKFNQIDDGGPGQLSGAWLITGRESEGQIKRSTPGARRTMKILSGTRFQWIAYNVDTKEFFGTGGGHYTTVNGKYTENIEFFSRDNSRVGASLQFDFSIEEGEWHHKGLSSKGEPINEVWTKREKLGI